MWQTNNKSHLFLFRFIASFGPSWAAAHRLLQLPAPVGWVWFVPFFSTLLFFLLKENKLYELPLYWLCFWYITPTLRTPRPRAKRGPTATWTPTRQPDGLRLFGYRFLQQHRPRPAAERSVAIRRHHPRTKGRSQSLLFFPWSNVLVDHLFFVLCNTTVNMWSVLHK